jgi:uncharacterized protein YlxP (DUF503 family)
VHVAAVSFDLHLPQAHSLKDKRAIIKPILEGCRHRYRVAAAEVEHADRWQRAGLGMAVVSSTPSHASDVLDQVERFVWSFPEVEVVACERHWMEEEAGYAG